jgi:ubiquinone/menaquinone biosynthesis C-methylase UbiE
MAALSFQVSSFEDFAAADASFDLIVSGTAFHWVDPEAMFCKPARLLRPGGWLALLETGERYDDRCAPPCSACGPPAAATAAPG